MALYELQNRGCLNSCSGRNLYNDHLRLRRDSNWVVWGRCLLGNTAAQCEYEAPGAGATQVGSTGLFYFYTDNLGSVGAISDASGAVKGNIIRYEPFGQLRSSAPTSAIADRVCTGQEENREMGADLCECPVSWRRVVWEKNLFGMTYNWFDPGADIREGVWEFSTPWLGDTIQTVFGWFVPSFDFAGDVAGIMNPIAPLTVSVRSPKADGPLDFQEPFAPYLPEEFR